MLNIDGLPYWRLSGYYFLFFLAIGGFMPYWNLYLQSISMSAEQIGLLSAVVVVTKIFASPFWGWMVDQYGRRVKLIKLCALLTTISFAFVLFSDSFWWVFSVLLVFSIFWSAGLPLIEATTFSHLQDNTHDYTKIRVWGSISFIIGVLVLGKYFDIFPIFHLVPILIFLLGLIWLHSLSLKETQLSTSHVDTESFWNILRQPSIIFLFVVCFLVQASHGPYYTFFSIYLEANGYSNSFIGIAWAVGVLAEVLIYLIIHQAIIIQVIILVKRLDNILFEKVTILVIDNFLEPVYSTLVYALQSVRDLYALSCFDFSSE